MVVRYKIGQEAGEWQGVGKGRWERMRPRIPGHMQFTSFTDDFELLEFIFVS